MPGMLLLQTSLGIHAYRTVWYSRSLSFSLGRKLGTDKSFWILKSQGNRATSCWWWPSRTGGSQSGFSSSYTKESSQTEAENYGDKVIFHLFKLSSVYKIWKKNDKNQGFHLLLKSEFLSDNNKWDLSNRYYVHPQAVTSYMLYVCLPPISAMGIYLFICLFIYIDYCKYVLKLYGNKMIDFNVD